MNRKIFSLLLIVSLMMSLTIASFASDASLRSAGTNAVLRLSPGQSVDAYLYANDLDKNDKDLELLISLDNYPNAQYLFEVYDQTTSQRIILKNFTGKSTYYDFDGVIDPTHDYKILLTNLGDSYFSGHMFIIAR